MIAFSILCDKSRSVSRVQYTNLFLVLLILPICMIGGSSSILCIGSDGHIALEVGADGSCNGSAHDEHESECDCDEGDQDCRHNANCCGDCNDVALEIEDGVQQRTSQEVSVSVQIAPIIVYALAILESRNIPLISPDQTSPLILDIPLESLRTIRLLI